MIPLKDDIPSRTVPFVNYALLLANTAVFLYTLTLGSRLQSFFFHYGAVPALFKAGYLLNAAGVIQPVSHLHVYLTLVTSLFLHAGWFHFLGNMLYLWIFGDNIEDRMGHFRYLVFYLLCGVLANLAHLYFNPGLTVPSLGASGAISGVLGAYLVLYPRARVVALVPIFFFLQILQVPAFFFLIFWFLQQFLAAALGAQGGIAWWAHIGGFLAGMVLVFVFQKKKRLPARRDEWWLRRA